MGREIRRVPPNWEHPRFTEMDSTRREHIGQYRPCYDKDFKSAAAAWKEDLRRWELGEHEETQSRFYRDMVEKYGHYEFWEYSPPPDPSACRPAFEEEPTWFQVYETVSEGTPVSPPFATPEELIDYLARFGDFWDQKRGDHPPSMAACERFVRGGYAPSIVIENGEIRAGIAATPEPEVAAGVEGGE